MLFMQPDWDMFHSKHPAALLHATARVVSGSGIYVSDKPGAHDLDLLRRLVLPNGSVLRPQLPGRPTKDIIFADVLKDNKTLLKVYTPSLCLCWHVFLVAWQTARACCGDKTWSYSLLKDVSYLQNID